MTNAMRRLGLAAAALGLVVGAAGQARAGQVIRTGEIRNFDGDGDGQVDDMSIDRVTFTVTAGTQVTFDILAWENNGSWSNGWTDLNGDGEFTASDIQIDLFDSASSHLAFNDDGPLGNDGSVSQLDSYMTYTFAAAGTYFLTIGELYYAPAVALQGYRRDYTHHDYYGPGSPDAADHADWRLTMTWNNGDVTNVSGSGVAAVPEPSTLVGAATAGLFGLGYGLRRRKRAA